MSETNEPPQCVKCGDEYFLNEGCEPTDYCDPCAQDVAEKIKSYLLSRMEELNSAWDLNDYKDGIEPANVREANVLYCGLKKIAELVK